MDYLFRHTLNLARWYLRTIYN
uniref:Uncharacterized protein n=1 Tax=Rhizophora mucronata TaxID=61149 RepID=A0A2P2PR60_RHIMU